MAERVFHLVLPDDWSQRPSVDWAPRSLAVEGFIHASTATQLRGTLETHYATAGDVYLLELCPVRTAGAMRFEASRGGALFPHLYRALEPDDIMRWWKLHARDGRFELPSLGADNRNDDPAGRTGTPPDQRP